jgi:hypothetical protein
MYSGIKRANTADVAADTSLGFITTALPAAMAPAAGTNSN